MSEIDPFAAVNMEGASLFPARSIVRYEGWQEHVNRKDLPKPVKPTRQAFDAMSKAEKAAFATERKRYHAKLPAVETPDLKRVHAQAMSQSALNYNSAPGARVGLVLDGLGTVGKSTIASEFGRKYELAWRKKAGPAIARSGISLVIPVVYVTLPGNVTIKEFNRLIVSFMGISAPSGATEGWLTSKIIDATQECVTSLIIVDDIHYLRMRSKGGVDVNNHLKHLASCISATFVYAGIHIEESGLMLEGKSKDKGYASQTQHRFKSYQIAPFKKGSDDLKALLTAFENNLVLMDHTPGSLAGLANYIHDRTAGFIGAISNLVREAANAAIQNKTREEITRQLLDSIRSNHAAEIHRATVAPRPKKPPPRTES